MFQLQTKLEPAPSFPSQLIHPRQARTLVKGDGRAIGFADRQTNLARAQVCSVLDQLSPECRAEALPARCWANIEIEKIRNAPEPLLEPRVSYMLAIANQNTEVVRAIIESSLETLL